MKLSNGFIIRIKKKDEDKNIPKFYYCVKCSNDKYFFSQNYYYPYLYKVGQNVKILYSNRGGKTEGLIIDVIGFNKIFSWVSFSYIIFFSILTNTKFIYSLDFDLYFFQIPISVIGIYFAIYISKIGIDRFRQFYFLEKYGETSEGVTIKIGETQDIENVKMYFPIIKFYTKNQKEVILSSIVKKYKQSKIRSGYTVLYDPDYPEFCEVKISFSILINSLPYYIVSLILIIFSIISII